HMNQDEQKPGPSKPEVSAARFPGVAAIALWMLLESLIGVFGVLTSHFASHGARIAVLAVSTLLALAGLGLFKMRRWGWALALAAAFLTSSYGIYIIMRYHQTNYWVMTLANFVFFFYLVRPEILRRLK
ncbi:MAG TPA: hypothetical protein VHA06_21760, partial [Candidatus Angelobacter sp.]|nr:hypothetical protein [Candidatus Angelobacter sp.]